MSVNLRWPKFTVSGPEGPCGHQHQRLSAAINCAHNLSWRHRSARCLVRTRHEDGTARVATTIVTTEAP